MSETLGTAVLVLSTDDSKLNKGLANAKRRAQKISSDMRKTGKSMSMAVTLPIVGLGTAILKSAADFETGMNQVQALTGAAGGQLQALEDQAKELGATTQFSAGQAADAMGFLAQAGLDANNILGTMPATLDLAAASQVGLAETADMMTNIMQGFGLEAGDAGRASDVLTATFTNSNTNLRELAEAMSFAGPVMKGFGIRFEEASAAVGLMGNAGIKASRAGTALSAALVRLSTPAKDNAELMAKLGINVTKSDGTMKSLVDIVRELESSGASTADMMKIFGQRAGPAMVALVEQGSVALVEMTDKLDASGGKAKEIADVQMKGLAGAMKALKSALEAVAIAIAESGLLEWVTGVVKQFAGWIREIAKTNPMILKWGVIIAGVVAVAGPLLIVMGSLVPVIGGLVAVIGFILSPIGLVVVALVGLVAAAIFFKDEFIAAFKWVLEFGKKWAGTVLKIVFGPIIFAIKGIASAWEWMIGKLSDAPTVAAPSYTPNTTDTSGFSDDAFTTEGLSGNPEPIGPSAQNRQVSVDIDEEGIYSGQSVRKLVDAINVEMADDSAAQTPPVQ